MKWILIIQYSHLISKDAAALVGRGIDQRREEEEEGTLGPLRQHWCGGGGDKTAATTENGG